MTAAAARTYLLQSGLQFIVVPRVVKIIGEGENGAINLMHCPRTVHKYLLPLHFTPHLSQYSRVGQTLMRRYNWERAAFFVHAAAKSNARSPYSGMRPLMKIN
jgi:hypothetical protein